MAAPFFHLRLTSGSTGRSFLRNQNNSARGRNDEGFEAIAFGDPFSTTIGLVADPRLPGDSQSEDAGPTGSERDTPLRCSLNEDTESQEIRLTNDGAPDAVVREAPLRGALRR